MTQMIDALLAAGRRLAEALHAENEALAALDLPRTAGLARAEGPARQTAAEMTTRLQALGAENRRLLERAIAIQAQVIETIAGAALPRAAAPGYGAAGRQAMPRSTPALAVATRA
jgi:hypothetical protein